MVQKRLSEAAKKRLRAGRMLQKGKRRASLFAFRRIRGDQAHKLCPWDYGLHFLQKLPLARSLGREVQAQIDLIHDHNARITFVPAQSGFPGSYAEFP